MTQCVATSRRSGARCARHAIPAGTVCVLHRGAAPQVARAARRRLLDAFARWALWRIGVRPRPEPDVLALAAAPDRLRREMPAWWRRADRLAAIAANVSAC